MRWRVGHWSRMALLTGYLVSAMPGCSSSDQQAGVDEAVSGDEYGDEDSGNEGNNYADEGGNASEEGDNYANEGSDEGNYGNDNGGYDDSYGEEDGNIAENGADDGEYEDDGSNVNQALAEAGVDSSIPSLEEVNGNTVAAVEDDASTAGYAAETGTETGAAGPAVLAGPAGAIPEMGSKLPYVVRVGDTLAKISQKIYGDSNKWQEIAELTAIDNANRIRPGDVVYYSLNEQTLAFATAYEGTPRESITVQPGDSLSKIAQRVYGNSSEWKYVWRQNDIANPDRLEVGQEVVYLSPAALAQAYDSLKDMSFAQLVEKSALGKGILIAGAKMVQWDNHEATEFDTVNGFVNAQQMFGVFAENAGFSG